MPSATAKVRHRQTDGQVNEGNEVVAGFDTVLEGQAKAVLSYERRVAPQPFESVMVGITVDIYAPPDAVVAKSVAAMHQLADAIDNIASSRANARVVVADTTAALGDVDAIFNAPGDVPSRVYTDGVPQDMGLSGSGSILGDSASSVAPPEDTDLLFLL